MTVWPRFDEITWTRELAEKRDQKPARCCLKCALCGYVVTFVDEDERERFGLSSDWVFGVDMADGTCPVCRHVPKDRPKRAKAAPFERYSEVRVSWARLGPSEHLSWAEMACHDGTPYPLQWRETRAAELTKAFERVRDLCGFPLIVNSAYRTEAYNRSIGGAVASQHVQGRALDLVPSKPGDAPLNILASAARIARREGLLRGIGIYSGFVHIDTRPGRQADWRGSRQPIPVLEEPAA